MCGDREVHDAPALVRQHQKPVQDLEPDRRHNEEVHRDQCLQVVAEERPSGLRRRLAVPDHVLADAGLTDLDAELQKFAVNVRSPRVDFRGQHADQFAHVYRHRWAAGLAVPNLPTPEQAKALTLPANYRGRLDDENAGFPVVPDRTEPGPEKAVSGGVSFERLTERWSTPI